MLSVRGGAGQVGWGTAIATSCLCVDGGVCMRARTCIGVLPWQPISPLVWLCRNFRHFCSDVSAGRRYVLLWSGSVFCVLSEKVHVKSRCVCASEE